MNIFENNSSSNNYAKSISLTEKETAIKQINEIRNDVFQINNYAHINNVNTKNNDKDNFNISIGVNSKSLFANKSEMPNDINNNNIHNIPKLNENEHNSNNLNYAKNIEIDELNEKNIEAKYLINTNDSINIKNCQNNYEIAQKSSSSPLFDNNLTNNNTNDKNNISKNQCENKNETNFSANTNKISNNQKEKLQPDLENIENQHLIESKTSESDATAKFKIINNNTNNKKMLKPSNDKHTRKSKSASSFIRRLFSCGVNSSCAGRRNSSKSSSSCHGSDRAIYNSSNAINLKSNSNNGFNNNNKLPPKLAINSDTQLQFTSNESIINKFDGIKKYDLASLKPKSNDSIANKILDAKLNEKRDSIVNKIFNLSKNDKNKSNETKLNDDGNHNSNIDQKLNEMNNMNNTIESSSKLVVPILKINDDIITSGHDEYTMDNEEMPEESIDDEGEEEDENDDLDEGEDDEDEIVDEDDEYPDEQEAKLLKQLTLNQSRDDYDYDEENDENNYDGYEDEDEDEDEDDERHQKYYQKNSNNNINSKKSNIINSSIKQSSSASPVIKLNTATHNSNINQLNKINSQKLPSFSFDSEDKDLSQSNSMNIQSQIQLDQQANNNNPSVTDFYSKFLTANSIITDRGIVNIRTGSFNLGCQPASDQLKLSNDELTDSNEFFNSLNDYQNDFIRSSSNYSFRNNVNNNDYFKDKGHSFGGASNLLVPLLLVTNRRKNSTASTYSNTNLSTNNLSETSPATPNKPSIQLSPSDYELINSSTNSTPTNQSSNLSNKNSLNANSLAPSISINNNLLSTSNLPGDQERRCSHDPNIEKLHKTYINNVKLGTTAVISSASVSTTNTDSMPNILNSALINLDSSATSKLTSIRYTLNNIKKSKNSSNNNGSTKSNRNYIKLSNSINTVKNAIKSQNVNSDQSLNSPIGDDGDKLELESSEKSDVLNEISKVNNWLRDNKNHHSKTNSLSKDQKKVSKIPPMTISEDEDNYNMKCVTNTSNNADINNKNKMIGLNSYSYDDEDENETMTTNENKTKHSYETTDSAIDIRSYGSISTLSKTSSINSRVNWQSFSKYYRLQFFQQMDTTWTKYQISAMSLEQFMALRKLALIQFSKLVERQHSAMIRTFRLFSKKTTASEFQKAYDSIDSINASKSDSSSKNKSNASNSETNVSGLTSNSNINKNDITSTPTSIIIGNRKISHQLGAQMGMHPTNGVANRKRRKTSLKKLEKQLYYERKKDTALAISVDESSSEIKDNSEISIANSTYDNSNGNSSILSNTNNNQKINPKISTNVFGLPLSKIMQHTGQPLPQRILEAMRFLRKIAANEVGIFRKNGNKARINKLKESINKNESINFQSEDITVFDIADTIKLYFRELPECLITNKLSDILLTNYTRIRPEERKIILQQLMLLIPDENRLVLQTLLLFLSEIAKYHKTNQMTRTNLAVCFSPVIFSLNYDNKKKIKPHKNLLINNEKSPSLLTVPPQPLFVQAVKPSKHIEQLETITTENCGIYFGPAPLTPSSLSNTSTISEEGDCKIPESNSTLEIKTTKMITSQSIASTTVYSNFNNASTITTTTPTSTLMATPTVNNNNIYSSMSILSSPSSTLSQQAQPLLSKQNYKRKYSDKFNKAASSIVNFGTELSSSTTGSFFSDSIKDSLDNLEYMSKVVQLCVADMIKYSMDLFTVPIENFEKLKLSVSFGSEPHNLEYVYDSQQRKIKKVEFFTSNVNIQKIFWFYLDKYEDVSIYYFKNEYLQQQQEQLLLTTTNLEAKAQSIQSSNMNNLNPSALTTITSAAANTTLTSAKVAIQMTTSPNPDIDAANISSSLFMPQKNENFNDKLKLWKCCTLVKHQNLTLQKIINRIKNERYMWDDDYKEGKTFEVLDDHTDLYRYVITFMPPHPSRDFFEIRHTSFPSAENETVILTSTSVLHPAASKLIGDIRSNMLISKYVIEKLIATDTTTTFKITHYIKLDYKGFTLEFYNKTFGYMMARLLYNLKLSLLN